MAGLQSNGVGDDSTGIVGGTPAARGEIPYIVSFQRTASDAGEFPWQVSLRRVGASSDTDGVNFVLADGSVRDIATRDDPFFAYSEVSYGVTNMVSDTGGQLSPPFEFDLV